MIKVLQNKRQIFFSRLWLKLMGRSALAFNRENKVQVRSLLAVGDYIKSWDVNLALNFISKSVNKIEPILDIGTFCSELPIALHKMHFQNIFGIDLNPDVIKMPFTSKINYKCGDFLNTGYPQDFFSAITAISVIEHGYSPHKMFLEISRLLKPGGYFICSFDFWPSKIDTRSIKVFEMTWDIFNWDEVLSMVRVAKEYDLLPLTPLNYTKINRPCIHCFGKSYSFAFMIFRKLDENIKILVKEGSRDT